MLPPEVLDEAREAARQNPVLEVDFVGKGGHAGFITGSVPWRPFYYAEYRVGEFFAEQFGLSPVLRNAGQAILERIP
jgi:predicted alpha/beta-fold hydrolase